MQSQDDKKMSLLGKIFGDHSTKFLKTLQPQLDQINALEGEFLQLSNEALKAKTAEFRARLGKGETLDQILPEAFTLVREAARRTLNQRHFDVQIFGGMVLHFGNIAEMRTGEGKTLTSTLPAYLNALSGMGVHMVTVNDYLAKRDSVWMGQIFDLLGLSVGCIAHESSYVYDSKGETKEEDKERDQVGAFKVEKNYLRSVTRREAYAADITYGTNNEFGFDYLRDNMAQDASQMVQRELNYAIVDEVDSILIDEARTPLIISAPAEESQDLYYKFAKLVMRLKENDDYNIDLKMRASTLTEAGIAKMEQALGVDNLYTGSGMNLVHHLENALRAMALYHRDKDYVVKDGEVIIVDEFTGRLMNGRRYSEGLHQALEAKEGLKTQRESRTLATITFQNYFRLYKKISGMTGTAVTEAEEFDKIYKLETIAIPPNKKNIRHDTQDKIYKSEYGKFTAVVEKVKKIHQSGQPVLLGTVSISKNEVLGEMLGRAGVPHEVLNAKNHEREGAIIAQAGRYGAVTVATNMAGRGVDIILGGNPKDEVEAKKVAELGGLYVIGTERHEARRIDNQLRGRSGRQGDPGSSQFYVSMEDDLMKIFGSERIKSVMDKLGLPEDVPIENGIVSRSLETAQHKVESHNFDIRKHLLDYDDVLNKHREVVYKRRREILFNLTKPLEQLRGMIEEEIQNIVRFHTQQPDQNEWNLEEIYESINTIFPVSGAERLKLDGVVGKKEEKLDTITDQTKIIDYALGLADKAIEQFEARMSKLGKELGHENFFGIIFKQVALQSIDSLWIDHLEAIDYLRTGIGLRGYGQRDPLIEYKKESYRMFNELLNLINKEIVYTIFKTALSPHEVAHTPKMQNLELRGPAKESGEPGQIAGGEEKVGRNDPCPCGSGKKYKRCHGA